MSDKEKERIDLILNRQEQLSSFPDKILLLELVRRNGAAAGPKKTFYSGLWVETLVAVDEDHTAEIRMGIDDFELLHK